MIVASGSLVHCLETLSYRGAVVMANGQCDVPHLNEVLIKNWVLSPPSSFVDAEISPIFLSALIQKYPLRSSNLSGCQIPGGV